MTLEQQIKDLYSKYQSLATMLRTTNLVWGQRKYHDTAAAVDNLYIQHGFDYRQGIAATSMTLNITFPVPFDEVPELYIAQIDSAKSVSAGVPIGPGDLDTPNTTHMNITYTALSKTGFTGLWWRASNFSTNYYYPIVWWAVGSKKLR